MTRKTALGQQLSTKGQSLQWGESLSLANSSMDADQAHRSQIGLRNPNKNKESPKRRNLLEIDSAKLAAHFTRKMSRMWRGAQLGITAHMHRKLERQRA